MPSHWIKSSLSFSNSNCVEVADGGSTVLVRDSKNPDGPVLRFTPDEWSAFPKAKVEVDGEPDDGGFLPDE
jgi:hypothetical protein